MERPKPVQRTPRKKNESQNLQPRESRESNRSGVNAQIPKKVSKMGPDDPPGIITAPTQRKEEKQVAPRPEGKSPKEKQNLEQPSSTAKQKKPFWLTRAMADDFDRQDVLFTTFNEALFYWTFIIAVTIGSMGRRSVMFFHQTEALKGQFIEKEFNTLNDVGITFEEIKSPSDFWHYAESALLDSFYWDSYYPNEEDASAVRPISKDDKKILFENQLLGVPRIRQVKVTNDSCIIHTYFKRLFLSCFDAYTHPDEDRESFGPAEGTAWVHNKAEKTKSIPYVGKISVYEGSGFYQDLSINKEESAKIIENLKDNLWITRGTRAIFIDFSLYNANLAFFCICKLIFEFPPTGGILPSHSFQTVRLLRSGFWDEVCFYFECIVYFFGGCFAIEEIRELIYFKTRYFLQFWTYIDLTIVSLATANFLTSLIVFPKADDTIIKILNEPNKYGNLEYLGASKILYNNLAAALLFFSYVKIFKYLSFNKTMGQLNNTLKNCALDILGFSVMFFIIFFAFAELGYLLFGSQVQDFSSFGTSMFTLLRTILGDFEYPAIERANRVVAPIYFMSYIFFVFFVLLNMFLAIINDTYADVKTEIAIAPEEMQMSEFLQNKFYQCLQKCGCNIRFQKEQAEFNATIEQIRDALKKCGFSDLEIEMFFARYNIDPNQAKSGDYDVKKIMRELERQSRAEEKHEEDTVLVHVNDFLTQQERLDQIERGVQTVASKIDNLIKKLETLDKVRKNRAQS